MQLVRFVANSSEWKNALIKRDGGDNTVPIIALRAFTPQPREEGRISLYRLETPEMSPSIAAAYWLINKAPFALLGVDATALAAEGFELLDEVGTTYHTAVNPLHVDLTVRSAETAMNAARFFFREGSLLPVEMKEIHARIANDNGEGLIEFVRLATEKNSTSLNQMAELVGKAVLRLS